jgi:hypothetical protein
MNDDSIFNPQVTNEKEPLPSSIKFHCNEDDTVTRVTYENQVGEEIQVFPILIEGESGEEEYTPPFGYYFTKFSRPNTDENGNKFHSVELSSLSKSFKNSLKRNDDPFPIKFFKNAEKKLENLEFIEFLLEQVVLNEYIRWDPDGWGHMTGDHVSVVFEKPRYYYISTNSGEELKYLPTSTEKIRTLFVTHKFFDIMSKPKKKMTYSIDTQIRFLIKMN